VKKRKEKKQKIVAMLLESFVVTILPQVQNLLVSVFDRLVPAVSG